MDEPERDTRSEVPSDWLCLELANTVLRDGGAFEEEKLSDYRALVAWARSEGIVDESGERKLLATAEVQPDETVAVLGRTLALREAIWRVFVALNRGESIPTEELALLNAEVARAGLHREVASAGEGRFVWHWTGIEDTLEGVLWPVAQSAAKLLVSEERVRARKCANPECSLLFFDKSRNRNRRWCAMDHCGSQLKARRYYHRKKQASPGATG